VYAEIDDLNDSDLYSEIEEESNDDEDCDFDEHKNSVSVSDSSNDSDSDEDEDEDFEFDDLEPKQTTSKGHVVPPPKRPTESIEDLDGLDDDDLCFDSDNDSSGSKEGKDKPVPLYMQLKA
jgi:hypothetical protein